MPVPRRSLLLLLLLAAVAFARKEFVAPPVLPAREYPARDQHRAENVTAAADPYETGSKQNIFTVRYGDAGCLPIRLIISNDGDQPVALTDMKVQLVTGGRARLSPLDSDDLYRRLAKPQRNDQPSRFPLPVPRGKVKGGVKGETLREMDAARFAARAVEPHSTQAGFVFFDVEGISSPLSGSHLYLTGIRNAAGGELMYFDIPLDNYLQARPSVQ